MRKLFTGILASAIAGSALLLPASPALSHTAVQGSNPADGAEVEAPPAELWVKFSTLTVPGANMTLDQPIAVKDDAHLEVIDACGVQVDNEDSSVNQTQNQVTVTSGGTSAGRYELHWFAQGGLEGDPQTGVIDFTVTEGTPCKSVNRTDPAEDVEYGFDVEGVTTKQAKGGVTNMTIDLAKSVTCASFARKSVEALQVGFDTDSDDTDNFIGTVACKKDAFTLNVSSGEEGADTFAFPVVLGKKGDSLTAKVKASSFTDAEHVDVYALTLSEADECMAEPAEGETAPICSDRAPDLGVLRAF